MCIVHSQGEWGRIRQFSLGKRGDVLTTHKDCASRLSDLCILNIPNFSLQYLACLSTTSGNDKLAFDVGLQEHSQGKKMECEPPMKLHHRMNFFM